MTPHGDRDPVGLDYELEITRIRTVRALSRAALVLGIVAIVVGILLAMLGAP